MASTIGINLRVTGHCNQGGRKYMEDAFLVAYQQTEDEKDLEYAYFGIFDGHGGKNASQFAKDHLMNNIVCQKNFWADDDELVLRAIREGFLTTHMAMWKEVSKWPKTMSGLPSTSGTTASIAFIRRGKLYTGHVGDSKIVLGSQIQDSVNWVSKSLTKDHKPESPVERERIYNAGGCVMNKAGVERVVWYRPRLGHQGPVRRSTRVDHIPFLAVARSLGDLWSYNYNEGEFVVSPDPDVNVVKLDPKRDRCIVLASDGLWNMLTPRDAVSMVEETEKANEQLILEAEEEMVSKPVANPSKHLVDCALNRWYSLNMRADNTSVVTVLLDPPGPPKREVLLRQKVLQKLRPREESCSPEETLRNPIANLPSDSHMPEPVKRQMPAPGKTEDAGNHLRDPRRLSNTSWENRTCVLPKPVVLTPTRVVVSHSPPAKSNENTTWPTPNPVQRVFPIEGTSVGVKTTTPEDKELAPSTFKEEKEPLAALSRLVSTENTPQASKEPQEKMETKVAEKIVQKRKWEPYRTVSEGGEGVLGSAKQLKSKLWSDCRISATRTNFNTRAQMRTTKVKE